MPAPSHRGGKAYLLVFQLEGPQNRRMAAKTVPDSVFIGNEGAYLVPQLVNEMRFLWTPSGQFELGIDGTIRIVLTGRQRKVR